MYYIFFLAKEKAKESGSGVLVTKEKDVKNSVQQEKRQVKNGSLLLFSIFFFLNFWATPGKQLRMM